jgi:hypothetical protein
MAERSKAAARGRIEKTRSHRRRRVWVGALAALIAAGSLGLAAGSGLGASAREKAARADSASALDRAVSKEVNRVLLELWKMEGLEVRP